MTPSIQSATAVFPGLTHAQALGRLLEGVFEPLLGRLAVEHVQLCPQNHGTLTCEKISGLAKCFPGTRFRLHANVRVEGHEHRNRSLSQMKASDLDYYRTLAGESPVSGTRDLG